MQRGDFCEANQSDFFRVRAVAIALGILGVAAAAFLAGVFGRELRVGAVAIALGVFSVTAAAFFAGVGSGVGLGHKIIGQEIDVNSLSGLRPST